MKRIRSFTFILTASVVLYAGCNDEIDIYAEYQDITVVYGLLNYADTVHTFKINRIFQGDAPVEELAKDRSLSEYENLSGQLIEYQVDGNADTVPTGMAWDLKEIEIDHKDSGIFFYPEQTLYEVAAPLNENNIYELEVNPTEGIITRARTAIVPHNDVLLADERIYAIAGFNTFSQSADILIDLRPPNRAKIINVLLEFRYQNEFQDGSLSSVITIPYTLGNYIIEQVGTPGNEADEISIRFNSRFFYQTIAANTLPIVEEPNVKQRIPLDESIRLVFTSGDQDFYTYVEVAAPPEGILEDKPSYTNVENGVGIFTSRTSEERTFRMTSKSSIELVEGDFFGLTRDRGFCYLTGNDDRSCF